MKSRDPLRVPLTVVAVFAMLIAAGLAPAWAQDRADIKGSQIIGNRELPKVLYIVPWKKPLAGDQSGRPAVSVLDEALAPVDRDVFRRQVQYDTLTQPVAGATPAPTAAAK
jgi:hypothetical protein